MILKLKTYSGRQIRLGGRLEMPLVRRNERKDGKIPQMGSDSRNRVSCVMHYEHFASNDVLSE